VCAGHCVSCHGPEKEKGDLRIDELSRDFKLGADTHHWAEVIEQVNSGEMPPKKEKPQPTQEEIAEFVTELDALIKEGRAARMAARPAGGALSAEPEGVSEHGL
jgi:mono/diheme cytochrome c family protein